MFGFFFLFLFLSYMKEQDGATKAKLELNGMELHGRVIRVDYSLTSKPHDATPGLYMGAPRPGMQSGRAGPPGPFAGYAPPRSGYVPKDLRQGGAPGAGGSRSRSRSRSARRERSPPHGRDLDPPPASPPRE